MSETLRTHESRAAEKLSQRHADRLNELVLGAGHYGQELDQLESIENPVGTILPENVLVQIHEEVTNEDKQAADELQSITRQVLEHLERSRDELLAIAQQRELDLIERGAGVHQHEVTPLREHRLSIQIEEERLLDIAREQIRNAEAA